MRFVGFTFKKVDDESKFKNIASLFDEIEQVRDKQKLKKPDLEIEDSDNIEEKKANWVNKFVGNYPGTPKSPIEEIPTTLMVSPRKESSIKLPNTMKKPTQALDKKYTITANPSKKEPAETSKKTKEGSDTGRMLYMGNYKKGNLAFNRSSSNEPGNTLKLKSGMMEGMGSPKKPPGPTFGETLSSRKSPVLSESRKPDLLGHNMVVSPTGQAASKKKGFGFLGLKFLNKNKT